MNKVLEIIQRYITFIKFMCDNGSIKFFNQEKYFNLTSSSKNIIYLYYTQKIIIKCEFAQKRYLIILRDEFYKSL